MERSNNRLYTEVSLTPALQNKMIPLIGLSVIRPGILMHSRNTPRTKGDYDHPMTMESVSLEEEKKKRRLIESQPKSNYYCTVHVHTHSTPPHLRIGDPHDDGKLAARVTSSTAPPLPPVYYVTLPVSCDGALYVSSVTGGHLWLSHAETGADLSLQEWLQPLLLLILTAIQVQNLHVACVCVCVGGGFKFKG